MTEKTESQTPEQSQFPFESPKKKRRIRPAPAALRVQVVQHKFPMATEVPCATLLSWCDERFRDSELSTLVSPKVAISVLKVIPPVVSVVGDSRALVGLVELTAALLKILPSDQKIHVNYIDEDHPFSCASVPIYDLLKAKTIEDSLPVLIQMTKHLTGRYPTDTELSNALGKDRSTINRIRNRIKNGT